MQRKYEITIAPNYVPSWTIADAVRELLQNAIDAEALGSRMIVDYDAEQEQLLITSCGASLSIQSLLLGTTSKSDDEQSIGQFGEGYKIATLALLRNQKTITFYNGCANEIWKPRFIKSRRYGCDLLGFFVDKQKTTSTDLLIVVDGITPEEYECNIVPVSLMLREREDPDDCKVLYETSVGQVLSTPGDVYVGGLFVMHHQPYQFGYNLKPGYLKLDRDRKLASNFDLEWVASKVWCELEDAKELPQLIADSAPDVEYLMSNAYGSRIKLANLAWEEFARKYGRDAIPVDTQEELDRLRNAGHKPILVHSRFMSVLRQSSFYSEPEVEDEGPGSVERLKAWLEENRHLVSSHAVKELEQIIEDLEGMGIE